MCGVVLLHAVEERLAAARVPDVLDAHVHPFLDVPVPDDLVDDDAHRSWCDVVHDPGSSFFVFAKFVVNVQNFSETTERHTPMVEFVGHALLLCRVGFDVDDVAHTVVDEESRELDRSMLWTNQGSVRPRNTYTVARNPPLKPRLNIWRVRAR